MLSVKRLRRLIQLSCLSAIAYLLTLAAVPIIPVAPFLKLDLSDLPVLISLWAFGMTGGLTVAAVKWLLHLVMMGISLPNLLGSLSSLMASLILLSVWWLVWHVAHRHRYFWLNGIIWSTAGLVGGMALVNLALIPWYLEIMGMRLPFSLAKLILGAVLPFNLIKGAVVGWLFCLLSRRLSSSRWFLQ